MTLEVTKKRKPRGNGKPTIEKSNGNYKFENILKKYEIPYLKINTNQTLGWNIHFEMLFLMTWFQTATIDNSQVSLKESFTYFPFMEINQESDCNEK